MTSDFWVSHSLIQAIYCSITKQWPSMNESLNHYQINDLFYNTDSFSNTNKWLSLWTSPWISHSNNLLHNASNGPYERVPESLLIQIICSVILIHSVRRQVTGDMNESLNRPFKWFILKHWFTESFETTKLLNVALVPTVLWNKGDLHMTILGN